MRLASLVRLSAGLTAPLLLAACGGSTTQPAASPTPSSGPTPVSTIAHCTDLVPASSAPTALASEQATTFTTFGGGPELLCTYQYGRITLETFQSSSNAKAGYAAVLNGVSKSVSMPGIADQAFEGQVGGDTTTYCAGALKGLRVVSACYNGSHVQLAQVESVLRVAAGNL
jgi:hypothetical protein